MSPKRNVLKKLPWAYASKTLRGWHLFGMGQRGMIDYFPTARAAWAAAERALKGAR